MLDIFRKRKDKEKIREKGFPSLPFFFFLPLKVGKGEVFFALRSPFYHFTEALNIYLSTHQISSIVNALTDAMMEVGVELHINNPRIERTIFDNLQKIYFDTFVYRNIFFSKEGEYIDAHRVRARIVKDINFFDPEFYERESGEEVIRVRIKNGLSPVLLAKSIIETAYFLSVREREVIESAGALNYLTPKTEDASAILSYEQKRKVEEEINTRRKELGFGEIMFGTVPVERIEIGLRPSDLDIRNVSITILRQLCNIWGIDSSLFNDPDNKTYANKTESLRGLYINTIIPTHRELWSQIVRTFILHRLLSPLIDPNDAFTLHYQHIPYLERDPYNEIELLLELVDRGIISQAEAKERILKLLDM